MAELQTLPENLEQMTIEENDNDVIDENISNVFNEQIKELESLHENFNDINDSINDTVIAAPVLRAGNSDIGFTDNDYIFTISFNNTDYRVLFPESAREFLVVRDGVLVNLSSSNITGVVLSNDDHSSTITYHSNYLTIVPFTSTSGNTNAYRYGSYSYMTTYYPGTGQSLSSTTSYGLASVSQKNTIFSGFTSFQLIMIAAAAIIIVLDIFRGFKS